MLLNLGHQSYVEGKYVGEQELFCLSPKMAGGEENQSVGSNGVPISFQSKQQTRPSLITGIPHIPHPCCVQNPAVRELRTAWRLHLLGATTVWEADCLFLEATVGQFLDWEGSGDSLVGGENPFAQFDR